MGLSIIIRLSDYQYNFLIFIGFSLGDELGFAESIGNVEGNKRRSLNLRTGTNSIGVLNGAQQPQQVQTSGVKVSTMINCNSDKIDFIIFIQFALTFNIYSYNIVLNYVLASQTITTKSAKSNHCTSKVYDTSTDGKFTE